jgi:hypothetical protein
MYFHSGYTGGPYYIQKKDFSEFAKSRNMKLGILNLSFAVMFGVLEFFIYPEVLALYNEIEAVLPVTLKIAPYVVGVVCLVFAFLGIQFMIQSRELNEAQKTFMAQYSDDAMITVKDVFSFQTEYKLLFAYGISIAAFILTTVVPIYQLTSQL